MLGDKDVIATLPVKSVDAARPFYEGILGLERAEVGEAGAVLYRSGNTRVLVDESEYAGTNAGTAASWAVGDDFDAVVNELRGKGVTFERDELPGTTRDGDVRVMGELRSVWFRAPDGNILNVVNQPG